MRLRRIFVFYKNELFVLITNAGTYITALLMLLVPSSYYFFFCKFFSYGTGSIDLRLFYMFLPYLSIILIPVLTMDSWTKDSDWIFQMPFTTTEIVVAKWTAVVTIFFILQVMLISVPFCVNMFGFVDSGQVFVSNVLMLLFFCAACALGQFVSLLAQNNIISALLTALILAITDFVHLLPVYAGVSSRTASVINYFSFAWHFDSASKGIMDSRDAGFYILQTFLFLFLTVLVIERRKK